jgi:hypothetical protein
MQIVLDSKHQASDINKKNYSKNPAKIIEFHCFYIQQDNGIFSPTKLIKIGCLDYGTVRNLVDCVHYSTRPV